MAKRVRAKARSDKPSAPDVERARREAESSAAHAAMMRDPWNELRNLAHVVAGSKKPGSVDAACILRAVEHAVACGDLKALKRGRAWAQRFLEYRPQGLGYPSSRFAFAQALQGFIGEVVRLKLDADELAGAALTRLPPWAEAAGLGWHTHTPGDVPGLRRRIAGEIAKVLEREREPDVQHVAIAILVGWGLTRDDARNVFKKVKDPVPGGP